MTTRKFKISPDIKPYLENILTRRDIIYFNTDDEQEIRVKGLSGNEFHKLVVRAKCERRNKLEDLPGNTTYWVRKVENQSEIKAENPEFVYFKEFA